VKLILRILAVASALAASARAAQGWALNQAVLDRIAPGRADDMQCLATAEHSHTYVMAWTTRAGSAATSHLRLVGVETARVRVLQRIELRGGYASTLEISRRLAEDQKPVLIIVTQYGAAAAELRIMAVGAGLLRLVSKARGDEAEIVRMEDGAFVIAVHNRINGIDVPDLYRLESGRLVRCDSRYPHYYAGQLSAQHLSADSSVAPSLIPQFARLRFLSGDKSGAERLLKLSRQNKKE